MTISMVSQEGENERTSFILISSVLGTQTQKACTALRNHIHTKKISFLSVKLGCLQTLWRETAADLRTQQSENSVKQQW